MGGGYLKLKDTNTNASVNAGTLEEENLVGVYIQNGDDYEKSDTVPESGYILNDEESYCKVGDEEVEVTFSYDIITKTLSVTPITNSGTKCYLYFDEALILDVSIASVTISEGSSPDKLYISGGGLTEQIEIDNTEQITITGTTTTNGITVNSGTANITLDNVTINQGDTELFDAFAILDGANVTLIIEGENELIRNRGNSGYASAISLGTNAVLTINGSGHLDAVGGIVGSQGTSIIINSGDIYAGGVVSFPGIGGHDFALIEINGGTINAYGGSRGGAGIGGGRESSVTGTIRINGGTIYAEGGPLSAGIGGGGTDEFQACIQTTAPNIYISDNADVTAVAGETLFEDAGSIPAEDIGNGGFTC